MTTKKKKKKKNYVSGNLRFYISLNLVTKPSNPTSVSSLIVSSCSIFMSAKLESRFCPIVFRSHVFKWRRQENDRSAERDNVGTRE